MVIRRSWSARGNQPPFDVLTTTAGPNRMIGSSVAVVMGSGVETLDIASPPNTAPCLSEWTSRFLVN